MRVGLGLGLDLVLVHISPISQPLFPPFPGNYFTVPWLVYVGFYCPPPSCFLTLLAPFSSVVSILNQIWIATFNSFHSVALGALLFPEMSCILFRYALRCTIWQTNGSELCSKWFWKTTCVNDKCILFQDTMYLPYGNYLG